VRASSAGHSAASFLESVRQYQECVRLLEVDGYDEGYLGGDSVTEQAVVIKRLRPEVEETTDRR
jgi:hypothetical protein